jgi:hypothetical protein
VSPLEDGVSVIWLVGLAGEVYEVLEVSEDPPGVDPREGSPGVVVSPEVPVTDGFCSSEGNDVPEAIEADALCEVVLEVSKVLPEDCPVLDPLEEACAWLPDEDVGSSIAALEDDGTDDTPVVTSASADVGLEDEPDEEGMMLPILVEAEDVSVVWEDGVGASATETPEEVREPVDGVCPAAAIMVLFGVDG